MDQILGDILQVLGGAYALFTLLAGLPFCPVSRVAGVLAIDVSRVRAATLLLWARVRAWLGLPPLALLLLALFGGGCASLAASHPRIATGTLDPSLYCQGLSSDQALFGALAKGLGAAAGASGLSVIPVDNADLRAGLAITGASMGFGGLIFQFLYDQKTTRWEDACAAPPEPTPVMSNSACPAVASHLVSLGCKDADGAPYTSDFTKVCRVFVEQHIPFPAACVVNAQTCEEANKCR